ncbi:MAG: Ig-like domain-containing protein [bacterium]|nr:Ig-like domain-containing protein [bacterium]
MERRFWFILAVSTVIGSSVYGQFVSIDGFDDPPGNGYFVKDSVWVTGIADFSAVDKNVQWVMVRFRRVDNSWLGAWRPASPTDGHFDEEVESWYINLPMDDTPFPSDGTEYVIDAWAWAGGWPGSSASTTYQPSGNLKLDRTEPSTTITIPQDTSWVNQAFTIQGTATDNLSGIYYIEITIVRVSDATILVNHQLVSYSGTPTARTWKYTWIVPTDDPDRTRYRITIEVWDDARFDPYGNTSSEYRSANYATHTIVVNKDDTAPTSTILTPPNGDTITGTIRLTGISDDNDMAGVALVEINTSDGTGWKVVHPLSTPGQYTNWYYDWNAGFLTDGNYTIQTRAYDNSLPPNIESLGPGMTLHVDNTAPTWVALKGQDGDVVYHNGETVTLLATLDAPGYLLTCDFSKLDNQWIEGSEQFTDNGDNTYTIVYRISESNTQLNGTYTITATAKDFAGRVTSKTVNLELSNSGPNIQNCLVEYPFGQTAVRLSQNIKITSLVTATDAPLNPDSIWVDGTSLNDMAFIRMWDDGTHGDAVAGDNVYTSDITILSDSTGVVEFTLHAADVIPNFSSRTGKVVLDNTSPKHRLTWCGDADKIYKNTDRVTIGTKWDGIDYLVTANFSNLDSNYEPGMEQVTNNGDSTYTIVYIISYWNTTADASSILIPVTAWDAVGNGPVIDSSYTVALYNSSKPVTVTNPEAGAYVKEDAMVECTCPDVTCAVHFQVSPDSIHWYNLSGTPDTSTIDSDGGNGWNAIWHTQLFEDGPYYIFAKAYDENGYLIATGSLYETVIVDNTPPTLKISISPLPQNGDSTNGEVYVDEILLKGVHSDLTSGVEKLIIEVKNDSGDNINNSPILIPASDSTFSRCINLIEGNNYITVTAFDKIENTYTDSSFLTYISPAVSKEIGPEGGTIEAPDGAMLIIPPNALLRDTKISIKPVPANELTPCSDPAVTLLRVAHNFTPDGLIFHKPVTMILPYTEANLDLDQDGKPNYPEDSLSVFFFDGIEWLKVGEPDRDPVNNTLTIDVNHFTVFDLGVDRKILPTSLKVGLTKNPFIPKEGTTIWFSLPEPGIVTLEIYDLAGDIVATIVREKEFRAGENSLRWDGLSDFGRWVGSGIYVYVLEYKSISRKNDAIIKKPIGVMK